MSVLEKMRKAIEKKNSGGDDKDGDKFKLSGFDESRIREFEARVKDIDSIIEKMEEAGIDTKEVTAEIRNLTRDII